MDKNRFKNCSSKVRRLVLDFEQMEQEGGNRYFDEEQMEDIIDFYLDVYDLDLLTKAVEYAEYLYPQSDDIVLRRAHMLCAKEKYDDAMRLLRRMESQQPENTDVMYALGSTYSAMDLPAKAIQYYLRAAKDGVDLDLVYGNIGDEYVKLKMNDSALAYYKKALSLNPKETRCIYNMADIFVADNTLEEGIHFFSQFVERHPYSADGWLVLGEAYRDAGLYERAERALKYALTVDDKLFAAYDALAQTYDLMNQPALAVDTLQEALPFAEDRGTVFYNMGQCYYHQQNAPTAAAYFRKALEEDPYDGASRTMLAFCYQDMGDAQAAIDNMQRLVDYEPCNVRHKEDLLTILMHFDRLEEARAVFDSAMHDLPDAAYLYATYARELIAKQRHDEAMQVLRRCQDHCEETFDTYALLAVCHHAKRQVSQAQECVIHAHAIDAERMAALEEEWPDMCADPDMAYVINKLTQEE